MPGGVRLGLADVAEVRKACDDIGAVLAVAGIEGGQMLVRPLRSDGVELLVDVVRDGALGSTPAVGLCGVWVEMMEDSVLWVLPVGPADVRPALNELRRADLHRARDDPDAGLRDALIPGFDRSMAHLVYISAPWAGKRGQSWHTRHVTRRSRLPGPERHRPDD